MTVIRWHFNILCRKIVAGYHDACKMSKKHEGLFPCRPPGFIRGVIDLPWGPTSAAVLHPGGMLYATPHSFAKSVSARWGWMYEKRVEGYLSDHINEEDVFSNPSVSRLLTLMTLEKLFVACLSWLSKIGTFTLCHVLYLLH